MADTTPAFGPFSLDRSGKVLLRDGVPVDAGQRGIALLKALIEARGGTVTKAELMDTAWPDVVVDEGNLTVQIASLRKVLGITPDGSEWIVTVPRVGYRLAGLATANPAGPRANASARHPILAVLPFQNMSGDSEQEYRRWCRRGHHHGAQPVPVILGCRADVELCLQRPRSGRARGRARPRRPLRA